MALERDFQSKLIKEIKTKFDGCLVLKNDAKYLQGVPDLMILHKDKWAALEVKNSKKAHKQPNQEYYVNKMNKMSYAKFVSPENKDKVIKELENLWDTH